MSVRYGLTETERRLSASQSCKPQLRKAGNFFQQLLGEVKNAKQQQQRLTSEPLPWRASPATDRAREALLPAAAEAAAPSADAAEEEEVRGRRCGGATDADRALPPPAPRAPPLSGSRPLSRLAATSPRAEPAAGGEAEGEAAESKSGLVRVLA